MIIFRRRHLPPPFVTPGSWPCVVVISVSRLVRHALEEVPLLGQRVRPNESDYSRLKRVVGARIAESEGGGAEKKTCQLDVSKFFSR